MRPYEKKAYIEMVKRRFSISSHLNCSICSACGGACCKRGGCELMTCDVPEMSIKGIQKMLDTGKYSIAFFCADMGGMILPVPVITARELEAGRINYSVIRKPCSLQGEKGCLLSDDERPTLGLLFIPSYEGNCKILVDAMEVLADWFPHKDILESVVLRETGKSSNELFYQGCFEAAMQISQKLENDVELTDNEIEALHILVATGTIAIDLE